MGTAEQLVLSPFIVAEFDYLMTKRRGARYAVEALKQLADGSWELATIGEEELRRIAVIAERYVDQPIGAADASNVVLAQRYRTDTIVTLDHRHFRVIKTSSGQPLEILP